MPCGRAYRGRWQGRREVHPERRRPTALPLAYSSYKAQRTKASDMSSGDSLIKATAIEKCTLGELLDSFLQLRIKRGKAKPESLETYNRVMRHLKANLGEDLELRHLTPKMAESWSAELRKTHSVFTAAQFTNLARQALTLAVKRKLLTHNPFADVKADDFVPLAGAVETWRKWREEEHLSYKKIAERWNEQTGQQVSTEQVWRALTPDLQAAITAWQKWREKEKLSDGKIAQR